MSEGRWVVIAYVLEGLLRFIAVAGVSIGR
jgi:hypothetical protein